jgi:hypothetical protein
MPHDHPDDDHDHVHTHRQPSLLLKRRAGGRKAASQDTENPKDREPLPRDYGRGKLLFLDAFSGIAGDMLVAALVDLGVPSSVIADALRSLPLTGYELRYVGRTRSAIAARGLDVLVTDAQPSRDYASIRTMLDDATNLSAGARTLAQSAFLLLAEAEAQIHGTTVERVHFHEVGAVDSIVDIAAAAIALDYLGADVWCSPLPMGRGTIRSQHGTLPAPAPATVLCLRGVPTYDAGIDAELVTPTGACLVRAAAKGFARWPSMRPLHVGWGAGVRELADRPNVLRVVLGEPTGKIELDAVGPSHVVLELNIDDLSGELLAIAMQRAQEAGALDVWSTAIGMKKGRPAVMLSALARRADADMVARALLSETSSLGLRVREVGRIERKRRMLDVVTPYGTIAVKVADGDGLPANAAPEYEACRIAAEVHHVPVKQVFAAAIAAYLASSGNT